MIADPRIIMRPCTFAAAAALLGLAACNSEPAPVSATPGATVHPDPRYLVREIEPTGSFRIAGPHDPERLRRLTARPGASRAVVYGQAEGSDTEILAGVDEVAVDGEGRIYVLDAGNSVVRVVDAQGRYLTGVGQAGQGPGDLYRPVSIAIDGEGRLLVGDMLRRIQRFAWRDGTVELDTVLPVSASPYAICTTDSLIVAQGMGQEDSTLVQLYRHDGARAGGFGRVYQSGDPRLDLMIQSLVICRGDRRDVVLAPGGFVPELRVIGLDGRTRRLFTVEDMQTTRVEAFPDGSHTVRITEAGTHVLFSAFQLAGNEALLQYGLITEEARRDGTEYATVTTLLLDLETGKVLSRDTTLPRYIARGSSGFIEVADSTIPQIRWNASPP